MKSPPLGVLIGGFGTAIALVAPEVVINRMVAERQLQIVKALPDTLDLITASVEAGLTMDGAIARIVNRPSRAQYALAEELGRYLQEIRLGTARAEALESLGRRCGVSDLQSVVAALLQADSLGVGVGTVLRAQSTHLRTRRKQRAQEAAMKAPVKMLFPLVLFIFPSIFIVTLGPAVIRIIDVFMNK
jgi:tight adherence protein C